MKLGTPDRVPVMCQLSIGHYFIHSGVSPIDIWFSSEAFAEALVRLQRKYNFDGILVNLTGRYPDYKEQIISIDEKEEEYIVKWKNGCYSIVPKNDNPHYYQPDGSRCFPQFDDIDPEQLFYIDPWDITEISYPYKWGFENSERPFDDFFPPYHADTIKHVKEKTGGTISIHSEVFSPWSQFLELLNYENALMAIMDDPGKVKACLQSLTYGAVQLAKLHAKENVDAILISSAFAGGGLISREHYIEFVLPYEKQIVEEVKKEFDVPVYTHTCGSIGDRLDLMMETKTNGVDTLDPPPLGTVELEEAKYLLKDKAFIKGNIDPVNTLLYGSKDKVEEDVKWRLKVGKPNGGYILSSACSIAPNTPQENIMLLTELAEKYGAYD
ncbi:MAG: uroporphyrinogen decarboxylase family protein, partial [Ignavibacteriaceae bacterium]|nr:uroporphyrinogen decarboxylase family protein [Ignavibacteriaceae bacterium]